jgi:beta-glucosidase
MAVAYVSAFERMAIVTTPKHLIANVGDGGRDSYPIHLNERYLEEIHFPPFKACFEIGGTRSVMTSYNSYDGTACSANDWLLNQKLKNEWKFNGFVISDANATGGSVVLHNTASDYVDASRQAISGGLDVIFQTEYDHYKLFAGSLLDANRDRKRIDDAVSRVLRAKFQLGLFEHPYVTEDALTKLVDPKRHKEIAKKAALKSIVLLKNDSKTLPLAKGITVAVFGEDATEARLGGYSGPGIKKVSILEGLKEKLGEKKVLYAEGCRRMDDPYVTVDREYLSDGKEAGLQTEYFNNINLSGEALKVTRVPSIDFQWTISSPDPSIVNDFYSARWRGTIRSPKSGTFKIGLQGNDGFRLYIDDKLVIDRWVKQSYHVDVVDFTFQKDRAYRLRVEFFEPVGNGQLKLIWNVPVTQNWAKGIDEAVALAKKADVALVVAGIHEGEFQDRALLSLPGHQEMLIQQIAATGKPVVVILVGGSAITMSNWIDKVKSIVDVWYPGEEGGSAIADVLSGDYNPAGRLPVTFPVHEAQLPLVYNHKPTGRGDDYHNLSGLPLFPFGYGLSYTTFEYSDLKINSSRTKMDDDVEVRFTLKNAGAVPGDEVCQLYIKDELASVARPVMELKGFQRISLKPGESKTVAFTISPALLKMLNKQMEEVIEPGEFRIMIGASSRDIRLVATLTVE